MGSRKKRSRKRRQRFEVRYIVDREDQETWLTLEQVREKLPKGNWVHNRVLEEVSTAIEIGKVPSEFWALDRTDQAYIMAESRVKRTMVSYEEHLQKQEMKHHGRG